MKKYAITLIMTIISVGLSGCNEEKSGAGTSSVSGSSNPKYPSVTTSEFQNYSYMVSGQKQNFYQINTKDQFGEALALESKWNVAISVSCPDCTIDTSITTTYQGHNGSGGYSFSFTTNELKNYNVRVTFSPSASYSNYASDFPTGIATTQLAAQVDTIVNHNVCDDSAQASLHGLRGTSTIEDVERMAICDADDLVLVANDDFFLDKDLYLATNIDLASYYGSGGPEFSIGDSCLGGGCNHFSGTFSGNFKTISNFQRTNGLGLFGVIDGAIIQNLRISNSTQSAPAAGSDGGAVATGMISGSKLINVSVLSANISGSDEVGGLIGYIVDSSIERSSASGTVVSNNISGGLVGRVTSTGPQTSKVVTSSTSNTVSSVSIGAGNTTAFSGGLIGIADSTISLKDCYSTSSVTSEYGAGGLVGKMNGMLINAYFTGSVSGQQMAGGLAGATDGTSSTVIYRAFSSSVPTSAGVAGGLVGNCDSVSASISYYNSSVSACGTVISYAPSFVTSGNPATVADLIADVSSIADGYQSMQWTKTITALPVLK